MDIQCIQSILIRLQGGGMTQAQIGEEIGCSQPTISDMSSGKVGKVRPSWRIVQGLTRLAKERGVLDEEFTPDENGNRKGNRRKLKDRRSTEKRD